jgi:hypothetical protein
MRRRSKQDSIAVAQFAAKINTALTKCGVGKFEYAQIIAEADRELSPEEVKALQVRQNISDSKWAKYTKVGGDDRFKSSPLREICASSYSTAYEITLLPPEFVTEAVADGRIYRGITRAAIEDLRAQLEAANQRAGAAPAAGSPPAKAAPPIPKPYIYGLLFPKKIKRSVLDKVDEHLNALKQYGIQVVENTAWDKEYSKWGQKLATWHCRIEELKLIGARKLARKREKLENKYGPKRRPKGVSSKDWKERSGYIWDELYSPLLTVEDILQVLCSQDELPKIEEEALRRAPEPEGPDEPYEIEEDLPIDPEILEFQSSILEKSRRYLSRFNFDKYEEATAEATIEANSSIEGEEISSTGEIVTAQAGSEKGESAETFSVNVKRSKPNVATAEASNPKSAVGRQAEPPEESDD